MAVADTHVHHDYLSGAARLASRHGASYLLSADEDVEARRTPTRAGDVVASARCGSRCWPPRATPCTTRHSWSPATAAPPRSSPAAACCPGPWDAPTSSDPLLARHLGRAQWQSARGLLRLDPGTRVHPSHGPGSPCAARGGIEDGDGALTLGVELARNPVFRLSRDEFVDRLVQGFGPVPAHYRRMTRANRGCAEGETGRQGGRLAVDDLHGVLSRGGWLVDLRDREAYARGHLSGSVNVEYGPAFATWLGWLKPSYAELALVSDSPEELSRAVRDLDRIGIEGVPVHTLDDHPGLRPDP